MNIHSATPEEIKIFTEDAKRRITKIVKDLEEMHIKRHNVQLRLIRNAHPSQRLGVSVLVIVPGIHALKTKRRHISVLKGDAGRAFNLVKQVVKIRDFYDPDYHQKRVEWLKEQEKVLNARRGWGGPW